jgi:hypothetical protein
MYQLSVKLFDVLTRFYDQPLLCGGGGGGKFGK